jgi:predicted GTPase
MCLLYENYQIDVMVYSDLKYKERGDILSIKQSNTSASFIYE